MVHNENIHYDVSMSGEESVFSDPPSTQTAMPEGTSLDRGREFTPANPDVSDSLDRGREFTPANPDGSESRSRLQQNTRPG